MERSITITIKNKSEVELMKTGEHLDHGKWTDGIQPTKSIKAGGEGLIKAQKQTGSGYGATGDCEYTIIEANHAREATLEITFNKPHTGDPEVTAIVSAPYFADVKPDAAGTTSGHYEATITVLRPA